MTCHAPAVNTSALDPDVPLSTQLSFVMDGVSAAKKIFSMLRTSTECVSTHTRITYVKRGSEWFSCITSFY